MKQFFEKVLHSMFLALHRIILHENEIEWNCVLKIVKSGSEPTQQTKQVNNLTY